MRIEQKMIFKDSKGKEFEIGDVMTFIAFGRNYVGKFKGISNKGAMVFEAIIGKKEEYKVMPNSIQEIYNMNLGEFSGSLDIPDYEMEGSNG